MKLFSGMRGQILLLLLVVSLLPLLLISWIFYEYSRNIIIADRVRIYLNHIAQQGADKIDLFLTERREETYGMASNEPVESFLAKPPGQDAMAFTSLLNDFVQLQQVYDVLMVVDRQGIIRSVNGLNRFGDFFDSRVLDGLVGSKITGYPVEAEAWKRCMSGLASQQDWYRSPVVNKLYNFEDDDICRSYHLLFAQPVIDRRNGTVQGAWISIMNWEFIQAILDLVETDFQEYGLASGYAVLLDKDGRHIIGAPFRQNRRRPPQPAAEGAGAGTSRPSTPLNLFNVDIHTRSQLAGLRQAIASPQTAIRFQLNGLRYGGISQVRIRPYSWRLVVSLDERDIFEPVYRMGAIFLSVIGGVILLILGGAWLMGRSIIRPLALLQKTALEIARGDYSRRIERKGESEIAILSQAFNQMAATIEERRRELEEVNLDLERKVRQRTEALETSNRELQQALDDLHEAQDHLVQAEKMASLGRLMAGIAHEIKNPLNFIYGNTRFLDEYTGKIRAFAKFAESQLAAKGTGLQRFQEYWEREGLEFVLDDLRQLSANIHEGSERIKVIVDDLRTFSRISAGAVTPVDLRKVLDMCLNLLRNQYKNRIRIHRDYGELPTLQVQVGKVEQVFLNLLTNAIQAIEGEGDIWLRTRHEGPDVIVEIEDSGHGIPEAYLTKIFEPFFTTKDVGQGTGLGLSISYTIVQQHHGDLEAANRPDGGALFRVRLPVEQPMQEAETDD